MRVAGATVLLTGATGGIGRTLARRLTEQGAELLVTGRQSEALDSLAREYSARPVPADLSDLDDVRRLAEACADTDILIANAALPASGDLRDYTLEQIDRALAVNLHAPVALARLLAPAMAARGRGHLAFVGSLSGKTATPYSALYTATKFGLRGLAHSLRLDLRRDDVGVSLVQPGFVREAGMFADTGAPVPGNGPTVSPEQVADAVVRAIERDKAEVNVAPLGARLRCALYGQFPGWAARSARSGQETPDSVLRIVEAQRVRR